MKRITFPLLVCLTLFFTACNQGGDTGSDDSRKLFPIVNNPDNPGLVFLSITDKTEQDTNFLYTVKGLYQADTVGFLMAVNKVIPAGVNKDGSVNVAQGFRTGNIQFIGSGPESDRFVAALKDLWPIPGNGPSTAEPDTTSGTPATKFSGKAVLPLVFSSNMQEIDHSKSTTYSFKLFFDPDAAEPGEVFFTLDTYRRSIQFQEKEPAFRKTIIDAFAGN